MAKTYSIKLLIEKINHRNANSLCSADVRAGWNSILECVLMERKVYEGFGYLDASQVPNKQQPGIQTRNGLKEFPDETRRFYYVSRKL